MMKLTQIMTRTSLAAIAVMNLAQAPQANAEPIVITRGPNGAAHVVKADHVPADAKIIPSSQTPDVAQVRQKGIGGAEQKATSRLIQRGPNGAFFPSSK